MWMIHAFQENSIIIWHKGKRGNIFHMSFLGSKFSFHMSCEQRFLGLMMKKTVVDLHTHSVYHHLLQCTHRINLFCIPLVPAVSFVSATSRLNCVPLLHGDFLISQSSHRHQRWQLEYATLTVAKILAPQHFSGESCGSKDVEEPVLETVTPHCHPSRIVLEQGPLLSWGISRLPSP